MTVEELTERILYRLSLDPQARALTGRILERFRRLVGPLPASADHHHQEVGGLYQHSLEVALKMLEEFEGNIIMERKPDGSVDSFRSARNRPRWQYATFLAALCHDLGKVFDLEVRSGEQRWFPLHETYLGFAQRTKQTPAVAWWEGREHGAHGAASCSLLHHLLTREDFEYLGLSRVVLIVGSLAGGHSHSPASPLAHLVSKLDQASVEEAHVSLARQADSKIGQFLQALQELIRRGEIGVNFPGAQVYAMREKTAVVVPLAVDLARGYLRGKQVVLPPNIHLYNLLQHANLVEADPSGRCVRRIMVSGIPDKVPLHALIFPTERIVPNEVLPTLPPVHFELEADPKLQTDTGEQRLG